MRTSSFGRFVPEPTHALQQETHAGCVAHHAMPAYDVQDSQSLSRQQQAKASARLRAHMTPDTRCTSSGGINTTRLVRKRNAQGVAVWIFSLSMWMFGRRAYKTNLARSRPC